MLLQDMDRKLFAWFVSRLDARQTFRRAWNLTQDITLQTQH